MFKLLLIILIFVNILYADKLEFTKKEKSYLLDKKVIKVCVSKYLFPLEYIIDNKHRGLVSDVFAIFEKTLPIPIKLVIAENEKDMAEKIHKEKCDIKSVVLNNSHPYKNLLSSLPYISDNFTIITKLNKPFIENLKDVNNNTFIVKHKSFKNYLKKEFPYLKNIIILESGKKIFELLENNKAYAYIDIRNVSNAFIQTYGYDKVKINNKLDKKIDGSVGVLDSQPLLLSIFNKIIKNISKNEIDIIKNTSKVVIYKEVINYSIIYKLIVLFLIIIIIISFFVIKQNRLKKYIEEQKNTFEILYLKSTDGVLLIEDNKIIDCNEATIKILNYKNKTQILNTHLSQISPKYQSCGQLSYKKADLMIQTAIQNKFHRFEWIYKKSNNETFWVEVVLTPIKITNKVVIHVLWREINDRKKIEKQSKLLESQSQTATIGRLLSMIAHQWRQPLSSINSITSDIYHQISNKDFNLVKLQNDLFEIEDITHDLSQTISKIHNFYAQEKENKSMDIGEMIQECIDILFPHISKSSKPKFIINEIDTLKIKDSSSGLQQSIITIISNSIDIFEQRHIINPVIEITIYNKTDYCYIDIEDNGRGIPKENLDKIFDIKFSTKNNNNNIRGYGLSIAKDIIENNINGTLTVSNTYQGAKFTIGYKKDESEL